MADGIEHLKTRFEEEMAKFKRLEKDRERNAVNRQQLEGQLTENNSVKEASFHSILFRNVQNMSVRDEAKIELDLLDDDATVYKLIGPVLVKQDLTEARQNVDKRIDYIKTEIKRLEETMADAMRKQEEQKATLMKIQNSLKEMASTDNH
ncbi:putative prefoldin subunit 6 [Toxocara canis]|uniref:Probable prefoldin subunit 6 n=1 Tax=Toxocara canis TaxID=6265 RepID=A0A0B2V1F0_TOXCA|nr:putative prefoldin subunit 6 [Toxocara canis]